MRAGILKERMRDSKYRSTSDGAESATNTASNSMYVWCSILANTVSMNNSDGFTASTKLVAIMRVRGNGVRRLFSVVSRSENTTP